MLSQLRSCSGTATATFKAAFTARGVCTVQKRPVSLNVAIIGTSTVDVPVASALMTRLQNSTRINHQYTRVRWCHDDVKQEKQQQLLPRLQEHEMSPDQYAEAIAIVDATVALHKAIARHDMPRIQHLVQAARASKAAYIATILARAKGNTSDVAVTAAATAAATMTIDPVNIVTATLRGVTALQQACRTKNLECVQYLVESCRVNVNDASDDNDKWTALHVAACQAAAMASTAIPDATADTQLSIVQYLMEHNANVHARTTDMGATALHVAVASASAASRATSHDANIAIVKCLVEQHQANVHAKTHNGNTTLHMACNGKNADLVAYLMERNVNVRAVTNQGATALHVAVERSSLYVVQQLVQAATTAAEAAENTVNAASTGTDEDHYDYIDAVDELGHSALHLACYNNRIDLVPYLVESCHADTLKVDRDNRTPLLLAMQGPDSLDVVQYLVHYYMATAPDSLRRMPKNPWHYAATLQPHGLAMVQCFQQAGAAAYLEQENGNGNDSGGGGGMTALHHASAQNSLDIVQHLIESQCSMLYAQSDGGSTPLHIAAMYGHLDIVQYMVRYDNDASSCDRETKGTSSLSLSRNGIGNLVQVRNADGCTPLLMACRYNHLNVVQYLLESAGVNVNDDNTAIIRGNVHDVTMNGKGALHVASGQNHVELAKYLVEQGGINVDAASDNGCTPLHQAITDSHLDMVTYLVQTAKANVEVAMDGGQTALHVAAINPQGRDVLQYLVEQCNSNVQARTDEGLTAMHLACVKNCLENVQYLLQSGHADIHETCTKEKQTALHYASANGCSEIVQYLMESWICDGSNDSETSSAHVDETNLHGRTPVLLASANGHVDIVRYLVEQHGARVDLADTFGRTPLHMASANHYLPVVRYLVESLPLVSSHRSGDDSCIHATDHIGITAAHFAGMNGHHDVLQYLVESCGVDILDAGDNLGQTAWHFACYTDDTACARYILEACAIDTNKTEFVDVPNSDGTTALHAACHYNCYNELIPFLLDKCGASLDHVDSSGYAALHIASLEGHLPTVKLLVEKYHAKTNVADLDGNTALQLAQHRGHDAVASYLKDC